jgi:hypothetical protein
MKGAAVTVPARKLLEDQDPVLLELLRLAAEVILANPGAVPAGLYDQCDDWADALSAVLSRPSRQPPPGAGAESGEPAHRRQPAAALDPGRTGRGAQPPAAALEGSLCSARSVTGATGFIGSHFRGTPAGRRRFRYRTLILPSPQPERR